MARKFADHLRDSSKSVGDIKKLSKEPSRTDPPRKCPYQIWLRSRREQTSNLCRKNGRKLSWNFRSFSQNGGHKKTESGTLKIGAETKGYAESPGCLEYTLFKKNHWADTNRARGQVKNLWKQNPPRQQSWERLRWQVQDYMMQSIRAMWQPVIKNVNVNGPE